MATYFLSDMHLSENAPHTTAQFFRFLSDVTSTADAIYLLGDQFDAWLGDDHLTPYNQRVIDALKCVTAAGVKGYFLTGNHDFLMGTAFEKMTGFKKLEDLHVTTIYDERVLLSHGDAFCLADVRHQHFRREVICNEAFHAMAMQQSVPARYEMARQFIQQSQAETADKSMQIMDVTPEEIKRIARLHQVDILVHGHTHRPSLHYFDLETRPILHIVLSDWEERGNAFIFSPNGEKRLFYFD